MAKPHWIHQTLDPDTGQPLTQHHGCQHSTCDQPAQWQWQRAATEAEIDAETRSQGPYGDVHRNPQGPHTIAVFACQEHAPDLDTAALRHAHDCPAPDPGCACHE